MKRYSNLNIKKILSFIYLIIIGLAVFAQNYYISSSGGDDTKDGLSASTAWKTTTRVNQASLDAGDKVLFKRGDVWRYTDGEPLRMKSGEMGNRIVYSTYGSGEKPVISRSIIANSSGQWINQGGNIWKFNQEIIGRDSNTAFISYNYDESIGKKEWGLSDLDTQGEFYTDEVISGWTTTNITYIYSNENPANYYNNVAVVIGESGMSSITESTAVEYIIIDGINFYHCGWNGIAIPKGAKHILVQNCDISYCGGQHHIQSNVPNNRRGQLINTQGDIENFEVRYCRLSQSWEGAVALQGWMDNLVVRDVRIHHNLMYKNEYGLEIWGINNNSIVENVKFDNNTCFYNGYGWSNEQREPKKRRGASFFHWTFNGVANNILVHNNIFYKDRAPSFYVWDALPETWKTAINLNYNLYYKGTNDTSEGGQALWFTDYTPTNDGNYANSNENPEYLYKSSEFSSWNTATGFDQNSIIEQFPIFVNAGTENSRDDEYDFRLIENSPGLFVGTDVGLSGYIDIWGNTNQAPFNIGAYNGVGESATLNINDEADNKIQIYPNPAKEILTINSLEQPIESYKIYNLTGQVVQANFLIDENQVNISNLSKGIYFVKVISQSGKDATKKIIKK